MSMPDTYLHYPMRRYGMDHDLYTWSPLPDRAAVVWPQGARIALWITVALEWFPLNMKGQPFKPPGAMVTAYPDFRHYTLRDYGNRVGVYRVAKALAEHGIPATAAVNAAVAARYPALLEHCTGWGWEVIGSGLDMDHLHHAGLARADEAKLIEQTLAVLRKASGQAVKGWLSPAKSQSGATLELLAQAGLDYCCDWVNDDMPYRMNAGGREIIAMPHPCDIDDYTILINNHHTEDDFRDALVDQFDLLYRESATQGGRVMAISLHPWVIGQPYRIRALEEALAHIMRHKGVWPATGSQILEAWRAQQG
jgi:peptidoglycan/xylan/chitin deacetylase (PgdA/CDA1 family)